MKASLLILILISLSSIYAQSWQWSEPIALTDSMDDNINMSFIYSPWYDFIKYNYMIWEKNYGDSSAIMIMKPVSPDQEYFVRTSESGIQFANPVGQAYFDSTFFIVWQSNENGNFDLFGGFWNRSGLTGFHQITSDTLDDINPSICGNALVWERNGMIVSKTMNIIDTALVDWSEETYVDIGSCSNPVIFGDYYGYYYRIVAYEKMKNDSSSVFCSLNTDSIWQSPICIYGMGNNRKISIDVTNSPEIWWQHKLNSDWSIKGCRLLINDTLAIEDTVSYNLSNMNETSPSTIQSIFFTEDNIYTNLAFETDSTGDHEIFYVSHYFYSDPINISYNMAEDINPEFSMLGWEEGLYDHYRIWLAWQSYRNDHWQIWCRYADIPIVGIKNESKLNPNKYQLFQNYPNPFNSQTYIKYYLPKSGKVNIEIFDILGQKIKSLINQTQQRGQHQVIWDGRDKNNITVASGVYIYNLVSDNYSMSKKMLILK